MSDAAKVRIKCILCYYYFIKIEIPILRNFYINGGILKPEYKLNKLDDDRKR